MFSYSEAPLTENERTINEHFKTFDIVKLMISKLDNFAQYLVDCVNNEELIKPYNLSKEDLEWAKEKIKKLSANASEKPIMMVNMFVQFLPFYDSKAKVFDRMKFEQTYPMLAQTLKMVHAQQNPQAKELFMPDLKSIPADVLDRIYRYAGFFCDTTTQIINSQKKP
jgi:uncharacterized protein (DUF2384 family)